MKKRSLFITLGVILALFFSIIGVSFAYFTSKTTVEGNGSNTTVQTVTLEDTTVTINGEVSFNDLDIYSGHEALSVLSVNATGDKLVYYHLLWTGTNTLQTPINYTIYKTTSLENPTVTCEKAKKVVDGVIRYYETCTHNNFDNLGEVISTGTIDTSTEEETIKLVKNEEMQATSKDGTTVYYYVILEYPDTSESQNVDLSGSLSGTVGIIVNGEKESSLEILVDNNTIDSSRVSGSFTSTFTDDTAGTIFEGPADDYGNTTYFYAGTNPDNWVYFAGFYWRIIRVNGNGSIRVIYNGTKLNQTGDGTQISTSYFNSKRTDNAYVGFMYGTTSAVTYEAAHTNTNSSVIKEVLDTWYAENLLAYADKIDADVGFCGDRSVNPGNEVWIDGDTALGYGTNKTYYASYGKMYLNGSIRTTMYPILTCPQNNDLYTITSSNYGNKALTYPIGLITFDEVIYAGGWPNSTNSSFWLYSGNAYWTMSPFCYSNITLNASVSSSGVLTGTPVVTSNGVRPVINLTANSITGGSGTSSDPYIVQ